MKPIYKILADNKDLTAGGKVRLLSIRINDERGIESDTAEIRLDDRNGQIQWPRKGAELEIWIGFEINGKKSLINKGKYIAESPTHNGPPDVLTITARAADMQQSLKTRKTRSFHQQTLGQIIQVIANDHGLKPGASEKLAKINIAHIDQTNESDLNFITRLATRYDAIAKPAYGYLLFTDKSSAESASGQALETVGIDKSECDDHSYSESARGVYTGVKAFYHHPGAAKRRSVIAGDKKNLKVLSETYPDENQAQDAANAAFNKVGRETKKLELTLNVGKPETIAGGVISVTGYRKPIADDYMVESVTHVYDDNGLSMTTRLESKPG